MAAVTGGAQTHGFELEVLLAMILDSRACTVCASIPCGYRSGDVSADHPHVSVLVVVVVTLAAVVSIVLVVLKR